MRCRDIVGRWGKDNARWPGKVLFLIMVLCLAVTFLPLVASAAGEFAGGSGAEGDPYLVETAEQLNSMHDYLSAYFQLAADINLSEYLSPGGGGYHGGAGWLPIGTEEAPFTGRFYGDGFTISGLFIDRPEMNCVGLFGATGATDLRAVIHGVFLQQINVRGRDMVGGLVGYALNSAITDNRVTGVVSGGRGVADYAGGVTQDSRTGVVTGGQGRTGGLVGYQHFGFITNSNADVSVTGAGGISGQVGGLVGSSYLGTISGCGASGEVANGNIGGNMVGWFNGVGGLVGHNNLGTIINCWATGNVTGEQNAGGLVGNTTGGEITGSWAKGAVTVTGVGYHAGGLVGISGGGTDKGYIRAGTTIRACSAEGPVTVRAAAPGMYMRADGAQDSREIPGREPSEGLLGRYGGGLIGFAEDSTISNSCATGKVTGYSGRGYGGLAGRLSRSSVTFCHATGPVAGYESVGGLAGMLEGNNRFPGIITQSWAEGDVLGSSGYTGGLVGVNGSNSEITRSYSTGTVRGPSVGGLVGSNSGSISESYSKSYVFTGGYHTYMTPEGDAHDDYVNWTNTGYAGGLAGLNSGVIDNSFFAGVVSGSARDRLRIGGLVVANQRTINNSFTTGHVHGHTSDNKRRLQMNAGVVEGDASGCSILAPALMKRKATFEGAGWDFEEIWGIFENASYPFLQPCEDTVTVRGRVGTAFNFNFGEFTQLSGFPLMLREIPVIALNEAGLEIGRTYTDEQGYFQLNLTSLLPHEKYTLRAELRGKNGIFTVRSQQGYANEVVYLERKSLSGSQQHVAMVFEPGFVYAAETMTAEQKDILRDAAVYYAFTHQAARYARVNLALEMDHKLPVDIDLFSEESGTWYRPSDSRISIEASNSFFASGCSPSNREFHEFGHHVHTDSLLGGENRIPPINEGAGDFNHGGVNNSDSTDSLTEGFAIFYALLVQDHPYYRGHGSVYNLEDNFWYVAGTSHPYEQFNVASLLWDLIDDDNETGDRVSIPIGELWMLLQSPEITTIRSLYEALNEQYGHLSSDPGDELNDIDRLFVMHHFYSDANKNGRWDEGEDIGYADWYQSKADEGIVRHSLPQPQGTLLDVSVVDGDGAAVAAHDFSVKVFYTDTNRDYRYETTVDANGRLPVMVPPESSRLEIKPVIAGYTVAQALTLEWESFRQAVSEALDEGRETFMSHTFLITPNDVPEPVGLAAQVVNEYTVELSWEILPETGTEAGKFMLVRTAGDEPVAPLPGMALYRGSHNSYTDQGLPADLKYRYTLFTLRGEEISKGVSVTASPQSPIAYTVFFESNGGSPVNSQAIERGFAATEPAEPTKEGYSFAGWYTGRSLENAYDFSTPVTADITLYARWINDETSWQIWEPQETSDSKKSWTVTFSKTLDRDTISSETVYITDKAHHRIAVEYEYNLKELKVTPKDEYTSGEIYILWIRNLKAEDGKVLSRNVRMEFTIVN